MKEVWVVTTFSFFSCSKFSNKPILRLEGRKHPLDTTLEHRLLCVHIELLYCLLIGQPHLTLVLSANERCVLGNWYAVRSRFLRTVCMSLQGWWWWDAYADFCCCVRESGSPRYSRSYDCFVIGVLCLPARGTFNETQRFLDALVAQNWSSASYKCFATFPILPSFLSFVAHGICFRLPLVIFCSGITSVPPAQRSLLMMAGTNGLRFLYQLTYMYLRSSKFINYFVFWCVHSGGSYESCLVSSFNELRKLQSFELRQGELLDNEDK